MSRLTSIQAYEQLVKSGALKGQLADILGLAVRHGEGTVSEILCGTKFDRNRNLARARFTELKERGLIVETGQRVCSITGRNALTWEATNRTQPLAETRNKSATGKREILRIARALASDFVEHKHGDCRAAGKDRAAFCECGLADLLAELEAVTL